MRKVCSGRWSGRVFLSLALVATTAFVAIAANADWSSPPRFDGAGYAVLATALLRGAGYRAIDHPDVPRHGHFPPGYPAALAVCMSILRDPSVSAAHGFSAICTVSAVVLTWWWYRCIYGATTALLLGLALAVNWLWGRTGSAIQSEPLYLLLSQAAVLLAARVSERFLRTDRPKEVDFGRDLAWFVAVGLLLGLTLLTRHVGIGILLAILLSLCASGRWRGGLVVAIVAGTIVAPWIYWITALVEPSRTQVGLLAEAGGGVVERLVGQLVFYTQRIPDQVTGPFVEVATVFQSSRAVALAANVWAVLATLVVMVGWMVCLRSRRRRLAGAIPTVTLVVLLVWPFTEAGRFLVPLIPFVLIGALEGLAWLLRQIVPGWGLARARRWAAGLLLMISIPYPAYVVASGRGRSHDAAQQAFDAACDWIGSRHDRPGPVLTRHPGEVFWRTGRQALEVASSERPGDHDADDTVIDRLIDRYRVAFLLVDRDRYAKAVSSPLDGYARRHTDRVKRVWNQEAGRGAIDIYCVEPAR